MRFLGIDYGSKNIGLATAGDENIATPLAVLLARGKTPEAIAAEVATVAEKQGVSKIVIGESKDFNGVENSIMKKIKPFVAALAEKVGKGIDIVFEPEFMTTQQAERLQGKHEHIDASAAALILQSYLDRQG